jgi:cytochrome c
MRIAVLLAVALLSIPALAADVNMKKGKALAERKACFGCHTIETKADPKKIVGPAFKDVAMKYRNNAGAEAMLAEKVRKGGKGHWGEQKSMPAHVNLTEQDTRTLVKWVLAQ